VNLIGFWFAPSFTRKSCKTSRRLRWLFQSAFPRNPHENEKQRKWNEINGVMTFKATIKSHPMIAEWIGEWECKRQPKWIPRTTTISNTEQKFRLRTLKVGTVRKWRRLRKSLAHRVQLKATNFKFAVSHHTKDRESSLLVCVSWLLNEILLLNYSRNLGGEVFWFAASSSCVKIF
jgi:hypothetical protein